MTRSRDIETVFRERRSVRHFVPNQPVPRPLIEQAIVAAGWAPSPHGRQPWRFSIVESFERRSALADAMAGSWREQLALDGQDATTIELRLRKSRERMLDASLLIIPCLFLEELDVYPDPERQEAERMMAIQSFGAAVQNLLMSLHANGLDAGWMCAPLFCPELVRMELGLAQGLLPHAMIPVGYAAKDPRRRSRLPLGQLIVDWS